MEKFAARLRKLRLSRGLTQAGLARKLYVSKQAVSKWENAKAMPDVELLPKIAAIFGVDLDSLMFDENAYGNGADNAQNAVNGSDNPLEDGVRENAAQGSLQDNAGGRRTQRNGGKADNSASARKTHGKGSRRLSKWIYICIPMLIVVIVAAVLLSVYLPDKSQGNEFPPVIDTPPAPEDPKPVFTEIKPIGEDYHGNDYKYNFTGAENRDEGEKLPDKAYYRFSPKKSSDFTLTIATGELGEYEKRYFSEAKVRLYVSQTLAAEVNYGETLTYTKFMRDNVTYEFTVEMQNPYKGEIPDSVSDNGNHGVEAKMSFSLQLDYKHDFENVIVPYRTKYTIALRARDHITLENGKTVSSVKTFRIVNSGVLKITNLCRMGTLDSSMKHYYYDDALHHYPYGLFTDYIELLFRRPKNHGEAFDYDDDYNNDFYYLTIYNNTWDDIPLEVEAGDVETLNCSAPLNVPAEKVPVEKGSGKMGYRYYYLDASDIYYTDPPSEQNPDPSQCSYYIISQDIGFPSDYFYDTEGNQKSRDESYKDADGGPWHSIRIDSFKNCYIKVPLGETAYQIKIEAWKSDNS